MDDLAEKVREFREGKGLSRKAFGDALGVTEGKVQKIEIAAQRADHEFLAALATAFDVDMNWLFGRGEASPATPVPAEFVPVTRFKIEASAGYGTLVQDETGSGSYAFSHKFLAKRNLNAKHLAVISVKGDSMEPDLRDGDLILIDQAQTDPKAVDEGKIYVVRYGDELFVKRIQRLPQDGLMLVSSNPVYQPVMVHGGQMDGVKIIGRVVNSTHEW